MWPISSQAPRSRLFNRLNPHPAPRMRVLGRYNCQEPQRRPRVCLSALYDALRKGIECNARITRNHSWSLADDRIRLRIRRVDGRYFRAGRPMVNWDVVSVNWQGWSLRVRVIHGISWQHAKAYSDYAEPSPTVIVATSSHGSATSCVNLAPLLSLLS